MGVKRRRIWMMWYFIVNMNEHDAQKVCRAKSQQGHFHHPGLSSHWWTNRRLYKRGCFFLLHNPPLSSVLATKTTNMLRNAIRVARPNFASFAKNSPAVSTPHYIYFLWLRSRNNRFPTPYNASTLDLQTVMLMPPPVTFISGCFEKLCHC